MFACRMMRGQDETSTSHVGRKKGSIREFPTVSNLVSSMSMEELRFFSQVPDSISLELSDGSTFSIVGQADNAVYFTQEQFIAGLRFHVSLLVKKFLHVTRAPPSLVPSNVFWTLMGCSVLNFLY